MNCRMKDMQTDLRRNFFQYIARQRQQENTKSQPWRKQRYDLRFERVEEVEITRKIPTTKLCAKEYIALQFLDQTQESKHKFITVQFI